MWLALEKLYLTEETTAQRVRRRGNENDEAAAADGNANGNGYDMWEKRQLKLMAKLRKDLLRTL